MECDDSSMGWGLGVWRGGSGEVGAVMSGNCMVKVQELYSSHCICRPRHSLSPARVWRGGVGAVMWWELVKVQELYSSHCIC